MDTKMLISELEKLKDLLTAKEAIERELNKYRGWRNIIKSELFVFIFTTLILIFLSVKIFPTQTAISVTIMMLAILGGILWWKVYNRKKEYSELKIDHQELDEITEKVKVNNIVPEYYKTVPCLVRFISYLTEGRATTIDECKKIYELDEREGRIQTLEEELVCQH